MLPIDRVLVAGLIGGSEQFSIWLGPTPISLRVRLV